MPNRPGKPLFAGEQGRQRTEINYDRIEKIKGMNVTIVTTAKNDNVAARRAVDGAGGPLAPRKCSRRLP